MNKVAATGLAVGQIAEADLKVDPAQRRCMRVYLSSESAGEDVRQILNDITAVEIVQDDIGIYHEIVPYEHLIVAGSSILADTLRESLPRYFRPLAYRRLEFLVEEAVPGQDDQVFALFGSHIDLKNKQEAGMLRVIGAGQVALGGVRWAAHQPRGVIALGASDASLGLPVLRMDQPETEKALVVEPSINGPRMFLAALSPHKGERGAWSVLGHTTQLETVSVPERGYHDAVYPGKDAYFRLIPDSAASRPVAPGPIQEEEVRLDVIGLFLPNPRSVRQVHALSVRLSATGALCYDPFYLPDREICLLRGDFYIASAAGGHERLGPQGHVPGTALRVKAATQLPNASGGSPDGRHGLALVQTEGVPLASMYVAIGSQDQNNAVHTHAPLRFHRTRWVGHSDQSEDGRAIYLDWLSNAVHLIVSDGAGGLRRIGYAEYIPAGVQQQGLSLHNNGREFQVRHGAAVNTVAPGQAFRLGPLWVVLRTVREGA